CRRERVEAERLLVSRLKPFALHGALHDSVLLILLHGWGLRRSRASSTYPAVRDKRSASERRSYSAETAWPSRHPGAATSKSAVVRGLYLRFTRWVMVNSDRPVTSRMTKQPAPRRSAG